MKVLERKHKIVIKSSLLILFILFFNLLAGQNASDKIDRLKPNTKLLEHLIKLKVDSIRQVNNLQHFINDSILYISSRDHARYLTKELNLSHYQLGNKRKRTYHERAVKYGADDYYVSENLGQITIENGVSYNQAAKQIVYNWSQSVGSLVNIIASSHSIIGIASWFEKDKGEIRISASIATVTRGYKPRHYPALFPYASKELLKVSVNTPKPQNRYKWGINPRPGSKELENYRKLQRQINTLGMVIENDSVFIVFNNPRIIETLFENSDDGVALELVSPNIYLCKNSNITPIRRDEEFIVKGNLLQPYYRDYLIDGLADLKRKPKLWIKFVGKLPRNAAATDNINLVVLKGKRIVDIISFNRAPQKVFDLALSFPAAGDNVISNEYFIPHLRRDTLKLRVFFDQNKANITARVADSISRWVDGKQLQRAGVFAYASVEGPKQNNKDLVERRANEVIAYFSPSTGQTIPIVKVTHENWDLFFNQIQKSKFQFLTQMDTLQIRNYVNEKLNSRELEPLLARQRYVDLKILAYKVINDLTIDGISLSEYMQHYKLLKHECTKQPIPCKTDITITNRIEVVQKFILSRSLQGRIPWSKVEQLPIKLNELPFDINSEPLAKLYYNKLRFELAYKGQQFSHSDSLKILREINRFPNTDPVLVYNYFITLLKEDKIDNPEPYYNQRKLNEIKRLVVNLQGTDFDGPTLERLKLFYHFKNAEKEYFVNRFGSEDKEVRISLDFIFQYFKSNTPTLKTAIDISQFFSAFQQFDEAMALIEPFVFGKNFSKQAFKLYLAYHYANPRVKQNTDFYQLLKDAGDLLTPTEWCGLFEGEYPINRQVFDHEPLRIMYCKMCRTGNR